MVVLQCGFIFFNFFLLFLYWPHEIKIIRAIKKNVLFLSAVVKWNEYQVNFFETKFNLKKSAPHSPFRSVSFFLSFLVQHLRPFYFITFRQDYRALVRVAHSDPRSVCIEK